MMDLTSGLHQGRNAGSGDGRHQSVPLQVHVDLAMPTAPGLGRGKHTSTTAHVTEGTLAGTVSTTTTDTRNTGHGTTGSPGFGRGLVTGSFTHCISLALIAAHQLRNFAHHIRTDRGLEHVRQRKILILQGFIFVRIDADQRARCRQTLEIEKNALRLATIDFTRT